MSSKKLEVIRRIVQIIAIVASAGFIPLAIITPWSSERVVEYYGSFDSSYTVINFDIYLALAYILPVIGLLATNGSVKRYNKRYSAGTISVDQITLRNRANIRLCIICGQPNYKGNFCSYCGNQL